MRNLFNQKDMSRLLQCLPYLLQDKRPCNVPITPSVIENIPTLMGVLPMLYRAYRAGEDHAHKVEMQARIDEAKRMRARADAEWDARVERALENSLKRSSKHAEREAQPKRVLLVSMDPVDRFHRILNDPCTTVVACALDKDYPGDHSDPQA